MTDLLATLAVLPRVNESDELRAIESIRDCGKTGGGASGYLEEAGQAALAGLIDPIVTQISLNHGPAAGEAAAALVFCVVAVLAVAAERERDAADAGRRYPQTE